MASKRSQASGDVAPAGADDFNLIRGIGPAVASRLYSAGILTYAQLGALSPEDLAALVSNLPGMSAERIAKQDWIGQARALAPAEPRNEAAALADRQHYATFTVELLLDADGDVRRTRVAHIQSGEEEPWGGWDEARLMDFLARRGALRRGPVELAPAVEEATMPAPQVALTAEPASPPAATPSLGGQLRLPEFQTIPADAATASSILLHGQPFVVRITLDFTEVAAPPNVPLNYTATIYAKDLGGGPRQTMGEAHGTITPIDRGTINVAGMALPPSTYRPQAVVALTLPSAEPKLRPDLMAWVEGSLLQVY